MRLQRIFVSSVTASLLLIRSQTQAQTSFLGGAYTAKSDVSGIAKLADDVAQVRAASSSDIAKSILGIYGQEGSSTATNLDGESLSIGSIGSNMPTEMASEPYYHAFVYALRKLESIDDDEAPVFGNTILEALLGIESQDTLGMVAEAAVINVLWMYQVHLLEKALASCTAEEPPETIARYLDAAFAVYVGTDEQKGTAGTGHSLYDMAEQAAAIYNTKSESNQALVNEYIVTLYRDLQSNFGEGDLCADDPIEASKRFRVQIYKIVRQTTVSLIQKMMYHLQLRDSQKGDEAVIEKDFTEIYALQIYPILSMCSIHDADAIRDLLIQPIDKSAPVDVATVLGYLQPHYDCLGVTCEDVGNYLQVNSTTCASQFDGSFTPGVVSYGGYLPVNDITQVCNV